eukprot:scaffold334_cov241-Pinguiococcus_pyrenoidosus.AAC.12
MEGRQLASHFGASGLVALAARLFICILWSGVDLLGEALHRLPPGPEPLIQELRLHDDEVARDKHQAGHRPQGEHVHHVCIPVVRLRPPIRHLREVLQRSADRPIHVRVPQIRRKEHIARIRLEAHSPPKHRNVVRLEAQLGKQASKAVPVVRRLVHGRAAQVPPGHRAERIGTGADLLQGWRRPGRQPFRAVLPKNVDDLLGKSWMSAAKLGSLGFSFLARLTV